MELLRAIKVKSLWSLQKAVSLAICAILVVVSRPDAHSRPAVGYRPNPRIPIGVRRALDHISADSLRGHLSFIASDLLEGRDTPSRGLDLAAEYIAAQFRRAGLEPAGDDGYFQTAMFARSEDSVAGFKLDVEAGNRKIAVSSDRCSWAIDRPVSLDGLDLLKVDYKNAESTAALKQAQVEGKVIVTDIPDSFREDRSKQREMYQAQTQFLALMAGLKAALVISIDRSSGGPIRQGSLIDPENRAAASRPNLYRPVTVFDPAIIAAYDSWADGPTGAKVWLHIPSQVERPVKLHNVVGVLKGSDPKLKDTYVLITAHYDHLGMKPDGPGDRIFNGANDDGSGTVSVIELASALATLNPRPRRSIVFMTFFGEEKGLLGSRYYGRHLVFPAVKTIADVNLEHIGRTDDSEGPQVSTATLTGFDYSDMGPVFTQAGEAFGVKLYKHPKNSDLYFSRSDNQALADLGVPAHTLCVAFSFPDYHRVGDHWDKIDYKNMEKIDRMVGLAITMIANSPSEPKWNADNPKADRYLKAWQTLHGK